MTPGTRVTFRGNDNRGTVQEWELNDSRSVLVLVDGEQSPRVISTHHLKEWRRLTKEVYAAIRKSDGEEYVDVYSVHVLPEEVVKMAGAANEELPGWAGCNPVVRIARFIMTEE